MPQITWTELVLALTVIGIRRAWKAWRSVGTLPDVYDDPYYGAGHYSTSNNPSNPSAARGLDTR